MVLALFGGSLAAVDLLVALLQVGLLQVAVADEQLHLAEELLMGVDLLPLEVLRHHQAVVLLLVLNGNRLLQSF